jgi:hypothetical protein
VNVHLLAHIPNIDDLESPLCGPKTFLVVFTGRRVQRQEVVALIVQGSSDGDGGLLCGLEKFVGTVLGFSSSEPS